MICAILREKVRDMTQSYEPMAKKKHLTLKENSKNQSDNTKTQSNRFMESKPSNWQQKLCNQKDNYLNMCS